MSWNGQTLPDFPDVAVFDLDGSPVDLLHRAMDLERGAEKWYRAVLDRYPQSPFTGSMDLLARAEEGHAHLIYGFWARAVREPQPFAELYAGLAGDILESGQDVATAITVLEKFSDDPCVDIIEMSLSVELAAYDLYRNMAHRFRNSDMEDVFLTIAQAENEHMRIAAEALQVCELPQE